MQYNGHANNLDLVSDMDFWCGSDSTNYPIADKTRNANLAYDKVVDLIMQADGTWKFDDNNATDLPIALAALTADQYDYPISAASFIKIIKVYAKDSAGKYCELVGVTIDSREGRDIMEQRMNSGTPKFYIKLGNSILLGQTPSYTVATNGLKIVYQRDVSYFVVGDTTKVPGYARAFHRLISLFASWDYCAVNDLDKRMNKIERAIVPMQGSLMTYYANRGPDKPERMTFRKEDYGQRDNRGDSAQRGVNFS